MLKRAPSFFTAAVVLCAALCIAAGAALAQPTIVSLYGFGDQTTKDLYDAFVAGLKPATRRSTSRSRFSPTASTSRRSRL